MALDGKMTPAQAGYISLASTAVSGFVGAVGSIWTTKYNNAIAQSKANIARLNAQLMEQQAQSVLQQNEKATVRKTMAAGQVKAKARTALAANGVAVAEGSSAELQASTDLIKEMDVNTMKSNATREAWGYRMKAVDYEGEALVAQASKKSTLGAFGSTLLGSASQLANNYLLMTASGIFGDGTQKPAPIIDKSVPLRR